MRPMGLRFRPVGLRWVFVLDHRVFVLDQWVFVLDHRVFVLDQWVFVLDHGVFVLDQWVFVLDHRVFGLRSSFLGLRFRHNPDSQYVKALTGTTNAFYSPKSPVEGRSGLSYKCTNTKNAFFP